MTIPEPISGEQMQPMGSPSTATATLAPPPMSNKSIGLALAALLVGIGAFLFGLVPVFGTLAGIAAVVLGVFALNRQQSKGLAVTGIVLGAIGALTSIAILFGLSASVMSRSPAAPPGAIAQSSAPVADPPAVEKTAEPAAPVVPVEYTSALTKATSYSNLMHMSKLGVYEQLTSEYGEQFSPEAAQYGVDNVKADWNANALAKAKTYQNQMAMSPAAIHDQLVSEYGEKFTPAEADYAIQHLND